MELHTAVKKTKSIDALVSGYSPAKVEEEKELIASPHFPQIREDYEQYLKYHGPDFMLKGDHYDVITPQMINSFLVYSIKYEHQSLYRTNTGKFISSLIHRCSNNGHAEFSLSPVSIIDYLAWNLRSRELEVQVNEDVGKHFAAKSRYLKAEVQGRAGDFFGCGAKDCTLHLHGSAGTRCGQGARYSKIIVEGDAGSSFGTRAFTSTITCKGDIGLLSFKGIKGCQCTVLGEAGDNCGWGATNSTFRTSNKKTLKRFIADVPSLVWVPEKDINEKSGNKIIFINKGKEEVIADYTLQRDGRQR